MILHLIQKSPFQNSALTDCLNIIDANDSILLMQDGVYGLQHPLLQSTAIPIFALDADLLARGLTDSNINFKAINYAEFVNICSQHKQTLSWF